MVDPLSPDEGVRAALEAFLDQGESRDEIKCRYCGDSHAGNNCRVTGGHDFDATGGTVWEFSGEAVEVLRAALSTPVPEEGLPREPASEAEIHRLLFEGIRAMLIEGADPSASAEWASYDFWNTEGKTRNRFYVETKRLAEELTAKIKSSPAINNRIAEYTRKRDLAFDDAERQYWQNLLDGELARGSASAAEGGNEP